MKMAEGNGSDLEGLRKIMEPQNRARATRISSQITHYFRIELHFAINKILFLSLCLLQRCNEDIPDVLNTMTTFGLHKMWDVYEQLLSSQGHTDIHTK